MAELEFLGGLCHGTIFGPPRFWPCRTADVAFANDDGEFQRKFDVPRWRMITADFGNSSL